MKKLKKCLLYFLVCLTTLLVLGLGFIRYKTYQAHQSSTAAAKSAKITRTIYSLKVKKAQKQLLSFTKVLSLRKKPTLI